MKTDLRIPVIRRKLGVTDLKSAVADRIAAGLADPKNRLVEIVGALINVHKADMSDTRQVREKFADMTVEVIQRNGDVELCCRGVPTDVLYDGEQVIWASVEQISAAIRDVVFGPCPPGPAASSLEISAYVRKFVEHSGFLYRGERGLVLYFWGGHRIPREEYEFAKQTGYWLGLHIPDVEIITGCGTGVMKGPFKGAQVAYSKQRSLQRFGPRDYVGFTEKNILAAEPPNELVNRFVVFDSIENRMEAFIRASHRGVVLPGGAGTIEEIMTMLAVRLVPGNEEVPYEFDLVERKGGSYFRELVEYFRVCFGGSLDGLFRVFVCDPADYARHVVATTKRLPMRYLWNDDLKFDKRLQAPFKVSFQAMEELDLSTDQDPIDLAINLRRFFSAIVHLSVKDPDMLDSWGDERPFIRGDKRIVRATDELVRKLEASKRIHPNRKYATPYRIE